MSVDSQPKAHGPNLRRRQFLGAITGFALLGAGTAHAQSDSEDFEFEPLEEFLGNEVQAVGSDKMLLTALEPEDEYPWYVWTGHPGVPTKYTPLDEYTADSVLMLDKMDDIDHQVLPGVYNLLGREARNVCWMEGIVRFVEAVEAGKSHEDAVDDAVAAAEDYYSIPIGNLANFWTDQINKIRALTGGLEESFDWEGRSDSRSQYLRIRGWGASEDYNWSSRDNANDEFLTFGESTLTLPDGSERTVPTVEASTPNNNFVGSSSSSWEHGWAITVAVDEVSTQTNGTNSRLSSVDRFLFQAMTPDNVSSFWLEWDRDEPLTRDELLDNDDREFQDLLELNRYGVLWDALWTEFELVRDNLQSFAANSYEEIEAGELTTEEIVANHPLLLASEWSTDYGSTGHYSYAAASFGAMGMSHDLKHEMKITLHDGTKLTGTLFVSDSAFDVQVGEDIDPATDLDGRAYFAYESASALRELAEDEYRADVVAGEVQLNVEPTGETLYQITTTDGESVVIEASEWVPGDRDAHVNPEASTEYTADLSDALETPETQVDTLHHYYPEDTGDSVIQVWNPFTIEEAYNRETGEEVESVEGQETQDLSETEVQYSEEDVRRFSTSSRAPTRTRPTRGLRAVSAGRSCRRTSTKRAD